MTRRKQSRGTCACCGREMTKGGLSRHLGTCPERQAAIEEAAREKHTGQKQKLYHLRIEDAWTGDFWLDLEMNGRSTLSDLDRYLRAIWLECCGHMSRFSVGGWRGDEIPMSRRLERVVAPGDELTHIYDFGTSSETLVKVRDVREGYPLTEHLIFLMARNEMPDWRCAECEEPARWLCINCLIERNEWVTLCDEHVEEHKDDGYGGPIELVNSPRLGMCGYTGPADPPY